MKRPIGAGYRTCHRVDSQSTGTELLVIRVRGVLDVEVHFTQAAFRGVAEVEPLGEEGALRDEGLCTH